jgi:hypothetical protein
MKTMGSLNLMVLSSLFCPVRKKWVRALPEERVRQALIHDMTQHLGYPIGNMALETTLAHLPHLRSKKIVPPQRRADLVVFAHGLHPKHSFYPLLLVECKAAPLTKKAWRQMVGYNQFVGAYFIAVVTPWHVCLGHGYSDDREVICKETLFSCEFLFQWVHRLMQKR